jgi:DNA-binding NarL/FixJ family response regulator
MANRPPIRLLVVDDVDQMRLLLRLGLSDQSEIEVVGEASDGLEAVEKAAELRPDVTLLDVAMPRLDGLHAIPLIHQANPGKHIVMLTGFEHEPLRSEALASCASELLSKGVPLPQIVATVNEVAARPAKHCA